MRIALLLSFILTISPASAQTPPNTQKPVPAPAPAPPPKTGTTPAQPAPAPPKTGTTPAPAPAQPTPRAAPQTRRAPATTRGGIAITATSPQGATLPGVQVTISGPTERTDQTDASGQLTFPSLLTGTYRLRFEGEKVTTFEKEVTVQTGRVADVDVMLNPAPEPKVVTAAPSEAPKPAVGEGPKGEPLTLGVVDILEKDFVGRQPRRETLLSCSGDLRTSMIQLNEPLPPRLYDAADAAYYVLGGEGTIQMNGKENRLTTNGFASVPRGTTHTFARRGSRALVLLAVLSGSPCEQAK
jgi:hypothetical protein